MSKIFDWLGPVLTRELLQVARRRRYYVLRALHSGMLLYCALLAWQRFGSELDLDAMAKMAHYYFGLYGAVQVGFAALVVPILLCDTISSERRAKNFEFLFTTDIGCEEILYGKLTSRLLIFVLLVLDGVPVLCLLALFGGIDYGQLFQLTLAALAVGFMSGAIAVQFSARTDRPLRALIGAYARMLCVGALFPVFVEVPIILVPICGIIGAVHLSHAMTHMQALSRSDDLASAPAPKTVLQRWNEMEVERFFGKRNPLWSDPWLDFRMRTGRLIGRWWLLGISGSVVVCLLARLLPTKALRELTEMSGLLLMGCWPIVLLTALVLAIANPLLERKREFWTLLLVAPLEKGEILRGLFLALWPAVRWLLVFVVFLSGLAFWLDPLRFALSAVAGVLFAALLVLYCVILRVPGSIQTGSTSLALALPVVASLQPLFLPPVIGWIGGAGYCGILAAIALLTGVWQIKSATPGLVGVHLLAMHLLIVAVALVLPNGNTSGLGLQAATVWHSIWPIDLTEVVEQHQARSSPALTGLYILCLTANLAYAAAFLIWNFDRWANRSDRRQNLAGFIAARLRRQ